MTPFVYNWFIANKRARAVSATGAAATATTDSPPPPEEGSGNQYAVCLKQISAGYDGAAVGLLQMRIGTATGTIACEWNVHNQRDISLEGCMSDLPAYVGQPMVFVLSGVASRVGRVEVFYAIHGAE